MREKMNLADAYYLVFKDLTKDIGMFTGVYDAKNGKSGFMDGIATVMEYIAYQVGDDCYNAFCDTFAENMLKSEEKARQVERSE